MLIAIDRMTEQKTSTGMTENRPNRKDNDMDNIYENLPGIMDEEDFKAILTSRFVRIERICSRGHRSPETGWYDQDEHEWVMVLQGAGTLEFEDERRVDLKKGDYLTIPAHVRHRVVWTDPDQITVWLAVFTTDDGAGKFVEKT